MSVDTPRGQAPSIDPDLFGTLGDHPAPRTGTEELFAGEAEWLSRRQLRQKRTLLERVHPLLEGALENDEKVAYRSLFVAATIIAFGYSTVSSERPSGRRREPGVPAAEAPQRSLNSMKIVK